MIGSYRPAVGGPAGFASALRDALIEDTPGLGVGIVAVGESEDESDPPEVVFRLSTSDSEYRCKAAAAAINKGDIALIQFDVTSFGGSAGEQALLVLNWIRIPVVVVMHQVPEGVTGALAPVLQALGESADAVVTMSETARQRLIAEAGVAARKIMVIPHGAQLAPSGPTRLADPGHRPVIATWGLFEPGKGIHWALEAMSLLAHLRPLPRYIVAGRTRPEEFAQDGDQYWHALQEQAKRLDLSAMVEFQHGFLTGAGLRDLIDMADIVLLPYEARDQSTSAVLVEAIAAGKPVVATRFPHAQELLDGAHGGLLVAHQDPQAIAAAIASLLRDPNTAGQVVERASGLASALAWPKVAAQYRQLFDALLRRPGPATP